MSQREFNLQLVLKRVAVSEAGDRGKHFLSVTCIRRAEHLQRGDNKCECDSGQPL